VNSKKVFWIYFIGFIVIDQAVKFWTRGHFSESQSMVAIRGLFDLTLTYNEGIAFGKLQGLGVYLSPIAIVIAVMAGRHTYKQPNDSLWVHSAMGLLASGALGNLIDRLWHGKVTDMIQVTFVNFPVFNIADACISVAAAILCVRWTFESLKKPAPEEEIEEQVQKSPDSAINGV
jgi:signal peptidase II